VAAELLEGDPLERGDAVDVPLDGVVELHGAVVDEPKQDGARDLGRDRRQSEVGVDRRRSGRLAEADGAGCPGPLPRPRRPHSGDAAARPAELHRLVEHRVELRRELLAERRIDGFELGGRIDRAGEASGQADGERSDDRGGRDAPPPPISPPFSHRAP
jgi:hypothetical protein